MDYIKLKISEFSTNSQLTGGGANHLWCILYMIREALKNENISYFHIISGEDWPARNVEEIYDYFENNFSIYHTCVKLKDFQGNRNYYYRKMQQYYSFLNILDYKRTFQKLFVKAFVAIQTCIGVNRLRKLDIELARGLIWGEFPRKAMEYCIDYADNNPEFLIFLEYGFASEEFFFGSILLNSEEWKDKIIQKNFRYMKWEKRNGSYPAVLDESDAASIKEGDYMFIRKVRNPVSNRLIQILNDKVEK